MNKSSLQQPLDLSQSEQGQDHLGTLTLRGAYMRIKDLLRVVKEIAFPCFTSPIVNHSDQEREMSDSKVSVNTLTAVDEKSLQFEQWKSSLSNNPKILGGETTFPNSRLSVQRIGGALEQGESREVLREDYPYLTEQDLTFAQMYVKDSHEKY